MLSEEDFKQIRKIVREEVGNEIENLKRELGGRITMMKFELSGDMDDLKDRLKDLEIKVSRIEKHLKLSQAFD